MPTFKTTQISNLGKLGEYLAQKYLLNKGYFILETNFKNNFGKQLGEIDIIAQKDQTLVFVEVKTRKKSFSHNVLPEENITKNKLYKLNRITQIYLKIKKLQNKPYQFDAISILYDPATKKAQVKHLENIFI